MGLPPTWEESVALGVRPRGAHDLIDSLMTPSGASSELIEAPASVTVASVEIVASARANRTRSARGSAKSWAKGRVRGWARERPRGGEAQAEAQGHLRRRVRRVRHDGSEAGRDVRKLTIQDHDNLRRKQVK